MTDWTNEFNAPQPAEQGIDFWGIIVRRKWIVLACSLLGLVGGFLHFYRAQPVYQSAAQVLIERKLPPALSLGSSDPNGLRNIVADAYKHPVLLKSSLIVAEAVSNHQLASLPSLADGGAVGKIISGLNIVPVTEGLGIYNVTFKGEDASDTGKVVNAVLEEYHQFLETNHRDYGRETRDLIVRAEKELLSQLSAKEEAYRKFREQAPLIWKDGTGTNLHQERQGVIEENRSEILLSMNKLQAQMKAIEQHLASHGDPETLLMIEDMPKLDFLEESKAETEQLVSQRSVERSTLLPLLLEEEELAARYGADHPKVKSIRRRLESYKEFYRTNYGVDLDEVPDLKQLGDIRRGPTREQRVQRYVAALVPALNQQLNQLKEQASQLDAMFEKEQDAAKGLAKHQFQDEMYRHDIDRTQQLYEIVLKQLEGMDVVGDYEGYNFNILSAAGDGYQIAPKATKIFPMALILGFLAGGGLGFLVDRADKSFHDPVDVSRVLGVPVVGHIPMIEPAKVADELSQVSPVLCTVHRPKSPEAEAYRTIRTALLFNARGKSEQVVQVTSPTPGDGKSTLCANLAVAMANSGKSVLLLDADFRRPTQHKIFGLSTDVGLASFVNGDATASEATQMIECVPNLSVMVCGPRPNNPSELLSSIGFREVLDNLRHQYDFVIVDTPPLLAVSDPSAVAAQVDAVLLAIRITSKSQTVAKRAREILSEIGGELVGVVINGVTTGSRQYSYGASKYSYSAKKYGYAYERTYE